MRTYSELRRRMFNFLAFCLVMAIMAAMIGLGNNQVDAARQRLRTTTQQLQQIGGAP
jgi:hypothetical protein